MGIEDERDAPFTEDELETPHTMNGESLGELFVDITSGVSTLIRKEIELARIELTAIVRQKLIGAAFAGVALVVGLFLLPFVLLTLIEVLAIWLPRWGAALIVVGLMVLIGTIGVVVARRMLVRSVVPQRTVESVKEDIRWAKSLKR